MSKKKKANAPESGKEVPLPAEKPMDSPVVEVAENKPASGLKGFLTKHDVLGRKLFILLSVLLVVGMPILSFDFGITGDELVHKVNGENVLKYLETGGQDTTYRHYKNLYLYGGLFDASAAMIYQNVPSVDPYDVRHVLSALFGALLVIFTGLLARHLTSSWLVALLAMLLTVLSPRLFGDSMNNPKDIPFATAYVMALYGIIRYNKNYPKWDFKTALLVFFAIAIAINIRVGGILLLVYFGFYTVVSMWWNRRQVAIGSGPAMKFLGISVLVGIAAYFTGLIFFPYAHSAPIGNTLKALGEMENFQTAIRMLFEGRALWSDEIPWYYIPKWLIIAIPLFIHVGIICFIVFGKRIFRQLPTLPLLFLLFVGSFPVLYAIYKHSALYDGIRHFLFIMPMLNVIATIGWVALIDRTFQTKARWVSLGALVLLMLLPLRFMVANHPNEYIYFNELIGGIKGAHGVYETDYWMNSMKELSEWLIANDERIKRGEEVSICTNSIDPVKHYFETMAPNVKVYYASFKDRYRHNVDYYLSIPRFIDKDLLLQGTWPPKDAIRTVTVDGIPVGAISHYKDSVGYMAYTSAKKGDFATAEPYLQTLLAREPNNEFSIYELANGYTNRDSINIADKLVTQGLQLAPDFSDFLIIKGLLLLKQNKLNESYAIFERCTELNYRNSIAYYYKALILANMKDYTKAFDNINIVLNAAPNFKPAYILAADILEATGRNEEAVQYRAAANRIK